MTTTLPEGTLTSELAEIMVNLWDDVGVQFAVYRAREFQLMDSAPHFLDSLDRIAYHDYVPTDEDILRCRVPTTGVSEIRFKVISRCAAATLSHRINIVH